MTANEWRYVVGFVVLGLVCTMVGLPWSGGFVHGLAVCVWLDSRD